MSTIGYSWTPMDGFCAMFFRCVYGLIMFSVHVFVCFFFFEFLMLVLLGRFGVVLWVFVASS